MTQITVEQIQQRARAGDGDAQVMLARLFDKEGRHDVALGWLQRAADGGHALAATYLGMRFLTAQAAPFAPMDGARYMFVGADKGNAEAQARAAVLTAAGVGRSKDWSQALTWLKKAQKSGYADASAQLAVLEAEASFRGGRLDLKAMVEPGEVAVLREDPRILHVPAFASPAACDWVAERARPRLEPARTYNALKGGRDYNDLRTNTGTAFGLWNSDLVLQLLRHRIAAAAGLGVETFEPLNVLHYEPGQQFEPHYDWIDPTSGHFDDELDKRGQRIATALIYLNEGYDGGETAFPELDFSFKGAKGDLLVFFNLDGEGQPDPRTLHAGTPPTFGVKWVLSQWIRTRPQPII